MVYMGFVPVAVSLTSHTVCFSWHPIEFARRQTTRRQMSLPLNPLSVDQGIDHTMTDKSYPFQRHQGKAFVSIVVCPLG